MDELIKRLQKEVSAYGKKVKIADLLSAMSDEELEMFFEQVAQDFAQEGRI